MLGAKLFSSGLTTLEVAAICQDVATGLSGAGTIQSTATECTSTVNVFSTVAASSGAKLLSTSSAGDSQIIFNGGANSLKVYPDSGSKINSLSTNSAIILAINTGCQFWRVSTTQWIGLLSA